MLIIIASLYRPHELVNGVVQRVEISLYSNSWYTDMIGGLGKFAFSIMIISTKAFFDDLWNERWQVKRHYV